DVKKRLRDVGEARIAIEDALGVNALEDTSSAARPAPAAPRSVVARTLPALAAVLAVLVVALSLALWAPWRSAPLPTPRQLTALIGADASLSTDVGGPILVSPDGTTLAFAAQQAGQTRLFVRKLDQLQAAALSGTDGAANPFFSPDGQWIAFFTGRQLKKIS